MLDTLKEKQEYYQYRERPLRFKTAPVLDATLRAALRQEQLDRAYRFVWGGVVIVREEPNSIGYSLARGSMDGCQFVPVTMPRVKQVNEEGPLVQHEVRQILMPKYIHERARQARSFCYYDDLNRKISVAREELIPVGRLSRIDYRYVDFGRLYWHLEVRANAEELINARVYNAQDDVPEEDWTCIMVLKTKKSLYYEPGLEMIEVLQRREWENRNENLKDVARVMMQQRAKRDLERDLAEAAAETKQFNELFDDVARNVERGRKYSIPPAPTVTLDGNNRIVPAGKFATGLK